MKNEAHAIQNPVVRLRANTKAKLRAIAQSKRWTLTEAMDALCDEFASNHRISVPEDAAPSHTNGAANDSSQSVIHDQQPTPANHGESQAARSRRDAHEPR